MIFETENIEFKSQVTDEIYKEVIMLILFSKEIINMFNGCHNHTYSQRTG